MTEAASLKRRFPVALTIATAIVLAVLLALGMWQVERLKWKTALLAHVDALRTAMAQPITPVLNDVSRGTDADFTRVFATCQGLGKAPYLEFYSLRDGAAGVRLISACKVDSLKYDSILVDRGFVGDTVSARPPVDAADGRQVQLVGVLRTPDRPTFVTPANQPDRWYSRDVAAMAKALGASNPAPVFLMAESSSNPEWQALIPEPVPAEIPNRHLEYALTWFGLAATLACVYAAFLLRRRKS